MSQTSPTFVLTPHIPVLLDPLVHSVCLNSTLSDRTLEDKSVKMSLITITVRAGGSGPAAGADAGEARRVFHTGGSIHARRRQTRMFH